MSERPAQQPPQDEGGPDAFFVTALALGLARSGLEPSACLAELTSRADGALLREARELLAELSHHPEAVVERARELLEAAMRQLPGT